MKKIGLMNSQFHRLNRKHDWEASGNTIMAEGEWEASMSYRGEAGDRAKKATHF